MTEIIIYIFQTVQVRHYDGDRHTYVFGNITKRSEFFIKTASAEKSRKLIFQIHLLHTFCNAKLVLFLHKAAQSHGKGVSYTCTFCIVNEIVAFKCVADKAQRLTKIVKRIEYECALVFLDLIAEPFIKIVFVYIFYSVFGIIAVIQKFELVLLTAQQRFIIIVHLIIETRPVHKAVNILHDLMVDTFGSSGCIFTHMYRCGYLIHDADIVLIPVEIIVQTIYKRCGNIIQCAFAATGLIGLKHRYYRLFTEYFAVNASFDTLMNGICQNLTVASCSSKFRGTIISFIQTVKA